MAAQTLTEGLLLGLGAALVCGVASGLAPFDEGTPGVVIWRAVTQE
jgi:hypothetical protein